MASRDRGGIEKNFHSERAAIFFTAPLGKKGGETFGGMEESPGFVTGGRCSLGVFHFRSASKHSIMTA
jgi:hypothetical protein